MRTTAKEVKEQLREHVLDSFTKDYGWDSDDAVSNLKEQLKSFDYLPTAYAQGRELAMGGTFLIYNIDIQEFLNGLGINPDNKEYDFQDSFDLYVHLIARTIGEITK